MNKLSNAQIKPFSFQELGNDKIIQSKEFQEFSFEEINSAPFNRHVADQEVIRLERKFESMSDFRIDDKVRESRGLSGQEKNDIESKIQLEVNQRLEKLKSDAYQEGFQKGRAEGLDSIQKEVEKSFEAKLERVEEVTNEIIKKSSDLVEENKAQTLEFINRFVKWIILKEASKDLYLERLLEKLILELNERRNLIIKVGRLNFSEMPEVIKHIEQRLGQLPNVRIEIVSEIEYPGIIIESDNGLIDGSIEAIFRNIDKIFESVRTNVES